jgi:hypothetical protein
MHRSGEPSDSVVKFPPGAAAIATHSRDLIDPCLHRAAHELRNLRHVWPSPVIVTNHIGNRVGKRSGAAI